jgi:signal transduction histidine kinase
VILLSIFVYLAVNEGLRRSLDDSLKVSGSLAASTLSTSPAGISLGKSLPENNPDLETLRAQGATVRYVDSSGDTLGGFGSDWSAAPLAYGIEEARKGRDTYSTYEDEAREEHFRVYTLPILDNGLVVGFVQVVRDFGALTDALRQLIIALLAGGLVVVIGGGVGTYFLARRALHPIDTITQTAREISASDLSARLNMSHAYREVAQLADTFDQMLARLEASFARERRFTADASHELRTPLAAMEAILSVVRSEPRSAHEYEQALDDLADETARLRGLAEQLLQLSRETQPQRADMAPVDLSLLLADVAEALAPLVEAKALLLETHIEPALWVLGDSDSLIRVFVNLLDNAIKFTDKGAITVSASPHEDQVRVDVGDTGVGIPADRLPAVFERFFRGDPSRSTPGAGLGLALANQIVHNQGGTLTVRSTAGKGSTFTVVLQRLQSAG